MSVRIILLFSFSLLSFSTKMDFCLPFDADKLVEDQMDVRRRYLGIVHVRLTRAYTIYLKEGAEIYSIHNGEVISTSDTCERFLGNNITVKYMDSILVNYSQLSEVFSEVGDSVSKGQQIGVSGSTGIIRRNGLRLEMSINEKYINPYYIKRLIKIPNKQFNTKD